MSDIDWDLFSSYTGLLTLASLSIYAGAFGSLPASQRHPDASANLKDEDEDDVDDIPDRMSSEDAWLFPVIGSAVLVGLYAIVKYFGKEWINWFLGWYFSVVGVGSVWKSLIGLSRYLVGESRWRSYDKTRLLIVKGQREILSISLRTPSLILIPLGLLPSTLYALSPGAHKSVLLTDILSLSFAHNALSFLKIDSFKTGSILLSGLFFYDIWWVFGTEVMVKVATTLDVPIKLMWPKSTTFSSANGFAMLGLGDVVIPGVFIALALRYDYHRSTAFSSKRPFVKPYFYACLMAYIAGLTTTMFVMHYYHKAQPALLYLSPACILSFLMTATIRGELKDAWNWNDTPEQHKASTPASNETKHDSSASRPSSPAAPVASKVNGVEGSKGEQTAKQ